MERLTEISNGSYQVKKEIFKNLEDEMRKTGTVEKSLVGILVDKLAAYENTGLEPEEVEDIKKINSELKFQIRDVYQVEINELKERINWHSRKCAELLERNQILHKALELSCRKLHMVRYLGSTHWLPKTETEFWINQAAVELHKARGGK